MKKTLRWILFIPAGIVAGSLISLFIQFFVRIGSWWWGGGDGAWLLFVKSYTLTYFQIICVAWAAPPNIKPTSYKVFASVVSGMYFSIMLVGSIHLLSGGASSLSGETVPQWEVLIELLSTILGFLTAIFWDKKSIPLLLADTKGVHPLNSIYGQNERD